MKLIGQFDSPFVRRVGIAMRLYQLEFEHLPYSVFRDAEKIAQYNPLRRVPTLVEDDGSVLTESFVCLEYLDERMAVAHGEKSERLLLPRSGRRRLEGLRICALCTGVCDKAVSLAYEREIRESRSAVWTERCTKQVFETLECLESERQKRTEQFLLGSTISHADIALSCAFTFVTNAHPGLLSMSRFSQIRAHAKHCESMPEFSSVYQAFDVPKASVEPSVAVGRS
ncbi:MAG TPA: glutathione S-transferase family protein [Polyangiaceae bacterium]